MPSYGAIFRNSGEAVVGLLFCISWRFVNVLHQIPRLALEQVTDNIQFMP